MIAEKRKRLFIGIACQPNTAVKQVLADLQATAENSATGLRPVPEKNLHITLKFLGMVPEPEIAMICQVMQQVVSRQSPFTVQVHGFGCFRQALWLGIRENRQLQELAANLDRALGAIGVSRDQKRFRPHVTVARLRSNASLKISELQARYRDQDWQVFSVESVHLFESETLPHGARYDRLFSTNLVS